MWRKVLPVMVLLVALMVGCRSRPATPEGATTALPTAPPGAPAAWGASLPAALQYAQSTGKPVVVDFFATWCGPCKMLEETWADPKLQGALGRFVTVKIDVDQQPQLATEYKVDGVPTIVFLAPSGEEAARHVGYLPVREMRKLLDENS